MDYKRSENEEHHLTDEEIENRLRVGYPEIGSIAKRALPMLYSFKDETIQIGWLIVFKKNLQDFLMPWKEPRPERWIGRIGIHKDIDSLEDELILVESDNKDILTNIANRIAEKYKKTIGREMTISLAWEY